MPGQSCTILRNSNKIFDMRIKPFKTHKNKLRKSLRRKALKAGIIKPKKGFYSTQQGHGEGNEAFIVTHNRRYNWKHLTTKNYHIPFEEDLSPRQQELLGLT